jgi:iron complex transport system permease protein
VALAILTAALMLIFVIAISVGSEHVALGDIARIIIAKIGGRSASVPAEHQTIIADIRLPRVLMAIVVGAALSVAGAAYQALLRNPLGDPYILGISTGSALGAIIATAYAEAIPVGRPIAAFIGASAVTIIVYALGQTREGGSLRLILAGVITNAFLSSLVIFFLTALSASNLRSAFSWLIGDLSGGSRLLPVVAAFSLSGMAVIYINARSLNLLMMGEEDAAALGVEVKRLKITTYLAASLITGAATAASGVIGFVGLIIPHAIRLAAGSDNRLVVPAAALAGAAFLLLADTVARTVLAPQELHIGVITALVGAPVFIYLLRRTS